MEILFEDYHCIAINKPAGMLTQGPPGVPNLEIDVKTYIKEKYAKPGNVYLGIPHRLDRPVSGVVLFARNSKAARRIAEQFQQHRVRKIYWAIVHHQPAANSEVWEDWIRKIADQARAEPCEPDAIGAKQAITDVRIVSILPNHWSLLELSPRTGRMHQLRLQSSLRGCPILGDHLYGSDIDFGPPPALPRDRVIALHARSLTFEHPTRHEPITVMAPLPEIWETVPGVTGPTGQVDSSGFNQSQDRNGAED